MCEKEKNNNFVKENISLYPHIFCFDLSQYPFHLSKTDRIQGKY